MEKVDTAQKIKPKRLLADKIKEQSTPRQGKHLTITSPAATCKNDVKSTTPSNKQKASTKKRDTSASKQSKVAKTRKTKSMSTLKTLKSQVSKQEKLAPKETSVANTLIQFAHYPTQGSDDEALQPIRLTENPFLTAEAPVN